MIFSESQFLSFFGLSVYQMVKITEVSGVIRYVNASSIESYLPEENEVVMADGRILVIDPKESDVDALVSSGDAISKVAELQNDLDYCVQAMVNAVAMINEGKDPAILINCSSSLVKVVSDKLFKTIKAVKE